MNQWFKDTSTTPHLIVPPTGIVLPFKDIERTPLQIAVVVMDWDGTVMRSYETLRAVDYLCGVITQASTPEKSERFLSELVQARTFQGVLHQTKPTLQFFRKFVRDNHILLAPNNIEQAVATARGMQQKAFHVDIGLKPLQALLAEKGTVRVVYTNTGGIHLFQKMRKGHVDPESFDAIYANGRAESGFEVIRSQYHRQAEAFAKRYIPYKNIKKPSHAPLEVISKAFGVPMSQILVIGEGGNDIGIVWQDSENPKGHLAYHRAGALAIDDIISTTNERGRRGTEPIGDEASTNKLRTLKAPADRVIILENGLTDLRHMHNLGQIEFISPPHRADALDELRALSLHL